jgi:hypothetical protein
MEVWCWCYQGLRWDAHAFCASPLQVQQCRQASCRLHHHGVRDSKPPQPGWQAHLFPRLFRDPDCQKILDGFLQPCPEDCWVLPCFFQLCRAKEMDHPARIQAVSQERQAHLAIRIQPEPP